MPSVLSGQEKERVRMKTVNVKKNQIKQKNMNNWQAKQNNYLSQNGEYFFFFLSKVIKYLCQYQNICQLIFINLCIFKLQQDSFLLSFGDSGWRQSQCLTSSNLYFWWSSKEKKNIKDLPPPLFVLWIIKISSLFPKLAFLSMGKP